MLFLNTRSFSLFVVCTLKPSNQRFRCRDEKQAHVTHVRCVLIETVIVLLLGYQRLFRIRTGVLWWHDNHYMFITAGEMSSLDRGPTKCVDTEPTVVCVCVCVSVFVFVCVRVQERDWVRRKERRQVCRRENSSSNSDPHNDGDATVHTHTTPLIQSISQWCSTQVVLCVFAYQQWFGKHLCALKESKCIFSHPLLLEKMHMYMHRHMQMQKHTHNLHTQTTNTQHQFDHKHCSISITTTDTAWCWVGGARVWVAMAPGRQGDKLSQTDTFQSATCQPDHRREREQASTEQRKQKVESE